MVRMTRRSLMQGSLAALGGCAATSGPAAVRGTLKQSFVNWCFRKHWDGEAMCRVAKELGCRSVELIPPDDWPTLKKYGLTCAVARTHRFDRGLNNPKYQEEALSKIRTAIDLCADFGFPSVISFTGFRENLSEEAGIRNCVAGYKKIIGIAEKKRINVFLEILNSRVREPMKGHPGYQGDHTEACIDIIKKVGSPRMKLLFDIYHVQVMDGDVIARIREHKDTIGHYHTAGNPGRGELDGRQEINYRPIMEAIAATGFAGYIGHEFIPTRDPEEGLREAVALCDV